jgi:hypothetical protein
MRRGIPLPERIQNAPELQEGLAIYLVAFYDLDTCRAVGMSSEGPIPWTAIQQWCQAMHLGPEETEDVHSIIRHLDNFYLRHRESRRSKTGKS